MKPLKLFKKQLDTLLPAHLLLDENLIIMSVGGLVESTFGLLINTSLASRFSIPNHSAELDFSYLKSFDNEELLLNFCEAPQLILQCKLCVLEQENQLLITIDNIDALRNHKQRSFQQVNLDISKLDIALEEIGHTFWFHDLDDALEFPKVLNNNADHDGFYDFFGNDSKRVLTKVKSWLSSIHPDDMWMIQEADNAYRNGQITHHALQYRIFDADGAIKWVSDKGIVYEYNDGKPKKLICIHTDITELNYAKLELDRQKKFYETILNNLPADIAVFDKDHTYLFVNPSGIKNEEIRQWIIGKKDEDYIQLRNLPSSILEGRRATFNEVKRTLKLKSWEQEIIKPDGSKEYILRIFHPYVNDNGEFELMIGYGIDITERKQIEEKIRQSEAKFKNLIDKSLALITTHTLDGVFTMVNPMVAKVFGYTEHEVVGHSITEFMLKEDAPKFKKEYINALKKQQQSNGVLKILNKAGDIVYLLYNNYLMKEEGLDPYVISYSVDITKRILVEKQLQIAQVETTKAAIAKERFLANMSHELRTPMNGILGMINFLEKTRLTIKQREYLELIKGSSNSLLVILNEVLDIEKIIAGKLELEKVPFNISETIAKVVESSKYKTDEKQLSIDLNDSLPDNQFVLGDPYRLGQIVLNLISNAIKFTDNGGNILVSIDVINNSTKSLVIEVSVTDTGIGIPKDKLNKIFEPFVQAEISISRKFGGTGLGLSICKHLVELQGGTIKAESAEGRGSVFSFIITYPKVARKTKVKVVEEKTKIQPNVLNGAKILVAEDVEVNQYIIKHLLEEWGCAVTIAENGKEAVEAVKKHTFDLVFMDIQMPEMDGFEATKVIRSLADKQKATIPVVAVTANMLKDIIKSFVRSGMNDYVLKPYDEREIFDIVEKFYQKHKNSQHELLSSSYNKAKHRRIAGGNRKFMMETAEIFVRTAPVSFNLMLDAFVDRDWQKMAKEAHKLKFSVNFFGMKESAELLYQIETMIAGERKIVALKRLVANFGLTLEACIKQLKNEFLN